jgi:hypothetical protein
LIAQALFSHRRVATVIQSLAVRSLRANQSSNFRAVSTFVRARSGYVQRRGVVPIAMRLYDNFNVLVELHQEAEQAFN